MNTKWLFVGQVWCKVWSIALSRNAEFLQEKAATLDGKAAIVFGISYFFRLLPQEAGTLSPHPESGSGEDDSDLTLHLGWGWGKHLLDLACPCLLLKYLTRSISEATHTAPGTTQPVCWSGLWSVATEPVTFSEHCAPGCSPNPRPPSQLCLWRGD